MQEIMVRKLVIVLTFFLMSLFPLQAYSSEQVIFDNRIFGATKLNLSQFIKDELNSSFDQYDFAKVDLNSDFFDEYILKKKNCSLDLEPKQFCYFVIVSEKSDKLIKLSVIYAKKILISGKKHNGIYDILAFQSKKDDYEYERYIWSPEEKAYMRQIDLSSVYNGIE